MISDEKLKDFLKGYVDILKEGVDISNDLPLRSRAIMPAGLIVIETNDGRRIASISVEGGGQTPSMPVCAADNTYATLFCKLINGLHGKED